ncbi:MAG: septum formation initiator family protein [Firmicutes bacterium]|jgi:cell division protein DivIC|nr:septum formation initiator family protein [Bacillota bacterium]
MKKTKKEKKRLFVISVVIILLVVSLVSSVAGDWTKIMENKSKITSLNKQYNDLLSEEEKLVSEVTKLQDDDYIVRFAKEKFLYSENGELIIRMN